MPLSNPTQQAMQAELDRLRRRVSELELDSGQADQPPLAHFYTNPDLISVSRLSDGIYVDVNDSFAAKLGFSRAEIIGRTPQALDIWQNPADLTTLTDSLETDGAVANFDAQLQSCTGELICGLLSANVIDLNQTPHVLSIIKDVSHAKRVEAEILRDNRKLVLLNTIITASAANTGLNEVLDIACRELGRAFSVPQTHILLFDQDKETVAVVAEYRRGDESPLLNQVIPIANDPTLKYLLRTKVPLITTHTDAHLKTEGLHDWLEIHNIGTILLLPLIINREIAGGLRIQMPESRYFSPEEVSVVWSVADQVADAISRAWLNEERYLLSTAVNQAADSITITDEQGIIRYVNPAFQRITGYPPEEVIGKRPLLMLEADRDFELHHQIWSTLKAGRVWHGHLTSKKRDDSAYSVETTITPIKDENGKIINYVSTQRDVTRELQLETQYRQSQKMEAIGQLTAGIAHDFNNLLMSINGFAELMQLRLPSDSPFQDMASRIVSSGESAANLIRQLLIFSRKQIVEPVILDLNQTVADIQKMLRRIIGEDIELSTTLQPDLWPIKSDPTQLEQIIVNLAVNARDAMPNGGKLEIKTHNMVLTPEGMQEMADLEPGNYVRLTVSDTGAGIDQDTLPHIFEPFFTTKEKGKGTGLGLSTVYGIIKQAGGDIQVSSRRGHGTTFYIYFPHAAIDDARLPAGHPEAGLVQGTETILLVEDSAAVQELVTLTLQAQGYHVLRAGNGEEALSVFKSYPGEVHLLLTDVVMPHMNGKELAENIARINPATKIIFTSGYTNEAIAHYGVLESGVTFLQKPFSPSALVSKVRQILDAP
ncbi:MAG: hypothetical protein Kow0031_25930 [Anaerolineae bacterium]